MSDATEPRPSTPFPAEIDSAAAQVDPLAGDWSAGLRGAARALGIPEPKLLPIEHVAPPPPLPLPAPVPAPVAETVEAPDAWAAASEDPLQSQPPPVQRPLLLPDTTPPSPAPAFLPDITPTSPAPAFLPESAPAAVEAEKTPPHATRPPEPTFEADKTPPMPTRIPEELRPDTAPPAVEVRSAAEEPLRKAPEIGGAPLGEPSPEALPSVIVAPLTGEAPTPWSEAVPATQGWGDTPQAATPAAAEESGWGGVSTSAATVISPVPSDPAPAWEAPPAAAVDPWSMPPPAAPVPDAWSAPPAPAAPVPDAWSAPPPAPPVPDAWSAPPAPVAAEEWKPDQSADAWQEVKKAEPPQLGTAQAADWSSLSKGPDWSAPPPAAAAPVAEDAWGAPPPPPAESAWGAPPSDAAPAVAEEWSAPPPVADTPHAEWAAPPPAAEGEWAAPPPDSTPSWNAPSVGASAMEQLESESLEATPDAAKDLFGSVPAGGSLAGDEEEAPEELPAETIEEKPVELSDDDADLLVPIEDEPAGPPPAQPLAAMAPISMNPLEVRGEHRVAVHTRGGGTLRGSMSDVDLSKAHFPLAPQGGGEEQPIYHTDVKAIFFMLAPGEKSKQGDGKKVRVTFSDGRSIDGHRDGREGKHGFFIVPLDAHRTNLRRIYVSRDATAHVKEI